MSNLIHTNLRDIIDLTSSEVKDEAPKVASSSTIANRGKKKSPNSYVNTCKSENGIEEDHTNYNESSEPLEFAPSHPQRRRTKSGSRRANRAAAALEDDFADDIDDESNRLSSHDRRRLASKEAAKQRRLKKARQLGKISIGRLADAVESEQLEMPEEYEERLEQLLEKEEKQRVILRKTYGLKYPGGVTGAQYESILAEAVGRRTLQGFQIHLANRATLKKIATAMGSISCGIDHRAAPPDNGEIIDAIHAKMDQLFVTDRNIRMIMDPHIYPEDIFEPRNDFD